MNSVFDLMRRCGDWQVFDWKQWIPLFRNKTDAEQNHLNLQRSSLLRFLHTFTETRRICHCSFCCYCSWAVSDGSLFFRFHFRHCSINTQFCVEYMGNDGDKTQTRHIMITCMNNVANFTCVISHLKHSPSTTAGK